MKSLTCRLGLLAVLTVAARSQGSASYGFFGSDCGSSTWIPVPLTNLSLPRLGTTLRIQTLTSSMTPGSAQVVYLLTGLSNTSVAGVPLPFDTSQLSRPGRLFCGNLYVSAEFVQPMPNGGLVGVPIVIDFPIPNQSTLIGARFYQQVMANATTFNDDEWYFTRAGVAQIGI